VTLNARTADVGDLVRAQYTFRSRSSGAVADPTAVTITVTEPDGTSTTVTHGGAGSGQVSATTKSSTGVYYADITIDAAGDWRIKWKGTGDVVDGSPVYLVHVKD